MPKTGRVYDVTPNSELGELSGANHRVFSLAGERIPFVTRVELDMDTDEGMATITAYMRTSEERVLIDYEKGAAIQVTFRTWVRVCPKGQEPQRNPQARLWRTADGTLSPHAEPLPNIPTNDMEVVCPK